jgi:hypothetical protein
MYTTKEFACAKEDVDGKKHDKNMWNKLRLKRVMMTMDATDAMYLHVGNMKRKNLNR